MPCNGTLRNGPGKRFVRCDRCGAIDYERNEGDRCVTYKNSPNYTTVRAATSDALEACVTEYAESWLNGNRNWVAAKLRGHESLEAAFIASAITLLLLDTSTDAAADFVRALKRRAAS